MIKLEVSTTMTLAEGIASRLVGQSDTPPIAEESRRFLEAEVEESGSRMMTLLAVISWYTDRGKEEEQEGEGETDRVGVRQAGGRGGNRPVCRVDGLNTEQKKNHKSFSFGSINQYKETIKRP